MAETPDMIRVLAAHGRMFSGDEPLLSAVGAQLPKNDPDLAPSKMSKASSFPLSTKLTIAMTPRRLVVFKSGWGNRVGTSIGDVELSRVANIEIAWNHKLAVLAFGLNDAPPVVMRSLNADAAEHFRMAFLTQRGRA